MNGALLFHAKIQKCSLQSMSREELISLVAVMDETILRLAEIQREEDARHEEELNCLKDQLFVLREMLFGRRSEKTRRQANPDQMCMFTTVGEDDPLLAEEGPPPETEVRSYTRRRKKNQGANRLPRNVKVIEEICEEEDPRCPKCGSGMTLVGYEDVREEIVIYPARAEIRRVKRGVYKCQPCAKKAESVLTRAEAPPGILPGSFASIEAVSWLINEKYSKGMPLYRIEQELKNLGSPLLRTTLCNWVLMTSEIYLESLWQVMREELLRQPVVLADETRFQVLHEKDREAHQLSYMWCYGSGDWAEDKYVIVDYQKSRGSHCPRKFLADFSRSLQCDGYEVYHMFRDQMHICGCWAHCRRKWQKAAEKSASSESSPNVKIRAQKGLEFCGRIFELERECKDMTPEKRAEFRQEKIKPVLDEFKKWLDLQTPGKSLLGRAVMYTEQQWPYLLGFLDDGLVSLTTNSIERQIRTIAVGRKNFLFAQNERGARAAAVCFSIILTAKQNGLSPIAYIEWVLTEMRNARRAREELAEQAEAAIRRSSSAEPKGGPLTPAEQQVLENALQDFDKCIARRLLPQNAPEACRVPEYTPSSEEAPSAPAAVSDKAGDTLQTPEQSA